MYAMSTSDTLDQGRAKLAQIVKDRRRELGYSVRRAADLAGVARGTWTGLEEGVRQTADNNYAGIERALQWAAGSIVAILAGAEPIESSASELAGTPEPRSAAAPDEALARVMRDSRLSSEQKRRIVQVLRDEKAAADRRRIEHAEQLIRLVAGE